MIIKSYLVYPIEGERNHLITTLNSLHGCEVTPSTNHELLVLVTESADDSAETQLETQLRNIDVIQAITLVSGHNEPTPILEAAA